MSPEAVPRVFYLAVWIAFAMAIIRTSRRQDKYAIRARRARTSFLSAGFLIVFDITCWLASYDWILSLEPAWASSIFGVYNFAGMFLGSLAAAALLAIWLRREKAFAALADGDRLHDLGTLLFAFGSFWMCERKPHVLFAAGRASGAVWWRST